MLDASSAAFTSGRPCVPSYHITALWQVSHTSQAGFHHTHTHAAVNYCFFPSLSVYHRTDLNILPPAI